MRLVLLHSVRKTTNKSHFRFSKINIRAKESDGILGGKIQVNTFLVFFFPFSVERLHYRFPNCYFRFYENEQEQLLYPLQRKLMMVPCLSRKLQKQAIYKRGILQV